MANFYVLFRLTSGEKHAISIEADSYSNVAAQVTDSRDGWFGIKGDMVNLRNVERVTIQESDGEEDFPFTFI